MEIARDSGSPVIFFPTCFEFFILIWDEQMSKQQFGIFICSCLSPSRSEDALICSLFHPRWQIGSSVLCSEAVTASRLPGGLFHTSLEITCSSLIYGRQMLCKLLPAQGWQLSLPGLPHWHLLQPQLEMGEGSAPANPEQGQQGSGTEHWMGLSPWQGGTKTG